MPNRVNWIWIPACDLERAAGFYQKVLDCGIWVSQEDGFAVFEWERGDASGGLELNAEATGHEGVRVLLNCEGRLDVAATAARANGGKITAVCSLGDYGIQVAVIDTEGNQVYLHSFSLEGARDCLQEIDEKSAKSSTT